MKRHVLFVAAVVFGFSFHSLMAATNLVQNSGFESGTDNWLRDTGTFAITAANGPSASGSASALLGGAGIASVGVIYQQIATVPGTSYVIQFDYETLDSGTADFKYAQVLVSDTGGATLLDLVRESGGNGVPTTSFQTAVGTFTAISSGATLYVEAEDEAVIDNVTIASGSFSAPGKYTGSVKLSSTIPSQSIASFHTESVVARITPSGGLFLIDQPGGDIEVGAFQNEHTLAYSGTTAAVTVKDRTDIKFTKINNTTTGGSGGLNVPVTDMETFKLKRVGK